MHDKNNERESFERRLNETFNKIVYLQLMSSLLPGFDFSEFNEFAQATLDFFKNSSPEQIEARLPLINERVGKAVNLMTSQFPPKHEIDTIATNWNSLFKERSNVFEYGITYGWLEEQMDLNNFRTYDYVPYHFRIGLATHKDHGGIEEEFLLRDAFNSLLKAEYYHDLLFAFSDKQKEVAKKEGKMQFDKEVYGQITDIKYEVAAFSRLTVVSFYAFMESFVNSVGFSHLQRNKTNLSDSEKDILSGYKKGRYLSLKTKIEGFQKIISADKRAKFITTDEKQIEEPFFSFFEDYEELRNASMHYSPIKTSIWLGPVEWLNKARTFSKIAVDAALKFWIACYQNSDGPQYLGKLHYETHYTLAKNKLESINRIETEYLKST